MGIPTEYVSVYETLGAQIDMLEAKLNMAVDRLGGMVEGNPIARHNFLQRVDELIAKEAQLERMREALRVLLDGCNRSDYEMRRKAFEQARAALEEK